MFIRIYMSSKCFLYIFSCAHVAKYTNNSKSMFLHFMARYLCMYNELMYERTTIDTYKSYKPTNIHKYMELLNELLVLNFYGSEGDFDDESEVEPCVTSEVHGINQQISILQREEDNAPKSKQQSRRLRCQRIKKDSAATTVKTNNKSSKRNDTNKKAQDSSISTSQSETNMSTSDFNNFFPKRGDPYLLWLSAVMLKRVDRNDEARHLLIRALQLQPCHWGAWIELSTLITDMQMVFMKNTLYNIHL